MNQKLDYSTIRVLLLITAGLSTCVIAPRPLCGQEDATPQPTTTTDPAVPLDELRLMLKPLTKADLEVEAAGWMALLKAKVTEISHAEIGIKAANVAISEAEEDAEGEDEAKEVAEEGAIAKKTLLDDVTTLREHRTALLDRVVLVLDQLDLKGGDTKEQRLYVKAVSGISVDVADASAAWVAVTGWLKSKEGGLRWGTNIVQFIATLIAFAILGSLLAKATQKAFSVAKKTSDLLRDFTVKMVRRAVLFVGLMVAITMLEVNVGPLLAVIGATGFVVGFALQGTLSNFASGLMILAYRPFDVGDAVSVAGVAGSVESMNLVSTNIKTFDNQRVVVPNNSIWGGVITNITGLPTRRVDMVFGISYSDDTAKAQTILEEILKEQELVMDDPAPVVKLHELADSSVNFICRPWVKTSDYWTVFWDVTNQVKLRFDAQGISIPFPQRDVHVYPSDAATA